MLIGLRLFLSLQVQAERLEYVLYSALPRHCATTLPARNAQMQGRSQHRDFCTASKPPLVKAVLVVEAELETHSGHQQNTEALNAVRALHSTFSQTGNDSSVCVLAANDDNP